MRPSLLLGALSLPAAALPHHVKRDKPVALLGPKDASTIVLDKYIVKVVDRPLDTLDDAIQAIIQKADYVFEPMFAGFSGTLDEATLQFLRYHPEVEYVEKDTKMTTAAFKTQFNATWGLGRISSRYPGANTYVFDDSAGEGTCVYVIDSGIDDTHPEFEGRAKQVYSFVKESARDDNGHGTHVAGIIGSKTYGVAKKTKLYGIKVLDHNGRGTTAQIVGGMTYVFRDMDKRECPKGVLVNLSLGAPMSETANHIAAKLTRGDIFVGVAAGNNAADAATKSPASEPLVCTVGGVDQNDTWWYRSNYGPLVDILAPAVNVLSTMPNGTHGYMTGTSMAAPHVVGLAAYLGVLEDITGTRALCTRIRRLANRGFIDNTPWKTDNLLAYNRPIGPEPLP
ncbi:RNAse P Rpr2/Rpp21/SNM1 subunit domain-containing protein [Purpureocillium lavendulum]|uniref:RNAse P Rpr2/Rpp21/SNM1 subunit domain-containing protein n=1 Tax=Purpureocillium lavendulum TaxID=1247861 RepID=A0AB34FMC2_9HYPO|nr:RNAse P Rpr2/Rpp21/SNM1 subunit domain-containing protein [Purpureocillium lavendulum]